MGGLILVLLILPILGAGYLAGNGKPGKSAHNYALLVGAVGMVLGTLWGSASSPVDGFGAAFRVAIIWGVWWAFAHWSSYGVGRLVRYCRNRRRAPKF